MLPQAVATAQARGCGLQVSSGAGGHQAVVCADVKKGPCTGKVVVRELSLGSVLCCDVREDRRSGWDRRKNPWARCKSKSFCIFAGSLTSCLHVFQVAGRGEAKSVANGEFFHAQACMWPL